MIPKVIHYCWFGRGEKSKLINKCIESWHKYCPDYEIIEWNEDNFDITCCDYVKEAYENRKFAFVTDYVRLFVMCNYGGVYMDTDVELVKPLDKFLSEIAFSGFETKENIPTGIMASEKGFHLFEYLLSHYDNRHFIKQDGSFDMTTNTITITEMLLKKGFVPNGEYQVIDGFALYPQDVFCPYDNATGILSKTNNTVAIHWFNKSWVSTDKRLRLKITRFIRRSFGDKAIDFIKKLFG